jgi:hypothetical protein
VADLSPIGIESAVHKVICLLPDIGDTSWIESDVQSVQDERGNQVRTERENIFIPSQGVIDWLFLDVRRIVELALSFYIDQVRIVLPDTRQAAFARIHDVTLPARVPQTVAPLADQDAAVDHRYQLGLCNVVEYVAWPGTIDAAEENVAVEGLTETVLFGTGKRMFFEDRLCGGGTVSERCAIISTLRRFAEASLTPA